MVCTDLADLDDLDLAEEPDLALPAGEAAAGDEGAAPRLGVLRVERGLDILSAITVYIKYNFYFFLKHQKNHKND